MTHPTASIDLRSDTVTLPTPAMLDAMQHARLGDDGQEGDPTVRALEAQAAHLLGKPAALFVTSGTMGNLVAVLTHARGPGEVLAGASSHLLNSERGGASLTGLHYRAIPELGACLDLQALEEALDASPSARCQTSLIALENSHNAAGGKVVTPAQMARVHALAQRHGVPLHTDGARLFNAAVALGVPPAQLAAATDTLSVCLSKGLSAPVGALLLGPVDFIARARAMRRMLGGTLRQGGVLAVAGIVALDQMRERLAQDHAHAKALYTGLQLIDPELCPDGEPDTNIVRVRLGSSSADGQRWEQALAHQGVLARADKHGWLRLVTHRHIDDHAVARTLVVLRQLRAGGLALLG